MSSIVSAVFKATVGLLVNKGRDLTAEKLKDGDVTDQRIRDFIVGEIDDIKSKVDGLARRDLLTSMSYFKRGVTYLFELLNKVESGKSGPEKSLKVHGLRSTATTAAEKTVEIAEGLNTLELTDAADKRALSNSKEEFKVACLKATEAFNNEALSTFDRIQAMVIRVAATILEKVEYPEDALAACRLCLEELHSMPAVKGSFAVEFKKGFRAWFSKAERREIILTVYRLNLVVDDVTQIVCERGEGKWIPINLPCVECRDEVVHVLRDPRVAETLRKHGTKHYWRPFTFSFGEEGEHKLAGPVAITSNTLGQFIIADLDLKVFDSGGRFLHYLDPLTFGRIITHDVATDKNNNTYALAEMSRLPASEVEIFPGCNVFELGVGIECFLLCFEKTGYLLSKFPLRVGRSYHSLAVSDNNKVVVLGRGVYPLDGDAIDVFKTDGQFLRSFGDEILRDVFDITAANDGRVMVLDRGGFLVQVFSDDGHHLLIFQLENSFKCTKIAFNLSNEHVVVAGKGKLLIYTKEGQLVRTNELDAKTIQGVTVNPHRCIGVACTDRSGKSKVLVLRFQ